MCIFIVTFDVQDFFLVAIYFAVYTDDIMAIFYIVIIILGWLGEAGFPRPWLVTPLFQLLPILNGVKLIWRFYGTHCQRLSFANYY